MYASLLYGFDESLKAIFSVCVCISLVMSKGEISHNFERRIALDPASHLTSYSPFILSQCL